MEGKALMSADAVIGGAVSVTDEQVNAGNNGEIKLEEKSAKKKNRVWEIDFLRALCIFLVWWDHTMCDVWMCASLIDTPTGIKILEFARWYWNCEWRMVIQPFMVYVFVVLSGISCALTRSNFNRSIKMMTFAGIFTIVTFWADELFNLGILIVFNVIHLISFATFVWALIDVINSKVKIPTVVWVIIALGCVLLGEYVNYGFNIYKLTNDSTALLFNPETYQSFESLFFNSPKYGVVADFLPVFPSIGYFLLGALAGKALYKEKKTLFPKFNPDKVKFICFCGRHTLWIYFGGQIVMFGLVFALSYLL